MTRTAQTRKGKTVEINTTRKVEGGYAGYVLDVRGYAVPVFVPSND